MEHVNINCRDCNNFCNYCYECENCLTINECKYCKDCKFSYDSINCLECEDAINCRNCYGLSHKKDLVNIVCFHEPDKDDYNDFKYYKILDKSFSMQSIFGKNRSEQLNILKRLEYVPFNENVKCIDCDDNCVSCETCVRCVNCFKCRDSNECINCTRCENCYKCYGLGNKLKCVTICKRNIIVYKGKKYKDIFDYPDYSKLNDEIINTLIIEGKIILFDDYIKRSDSDENNPDIDIHRNKLCENCYNCFGCIRCKDCYNIWGGIDFERIIGFNGKYYEDSKKVLDMSTLNDNIVSQLIKKQIIKLGHNGHFCNRFTDNT